MKQLQSIAGSLNFCCRAYPTGRPFIRRIYDLIGGKPKYFYVTLNSDAKEDLRVWKNFLEHRTGAVTFMNFLEVKAENIDLATDASGTIGLGVHYHDKFIQARWSNLFLDTQPSIALQELIAVAIAVKKFAPEWRGRTIKLSCDNESVVAMINNLTSSCSRCMEFVRVITETMLQFDCRIHLVYISTHKNDLADALSRFQRERYRRIQAQRGITKTCAQSLPLGPWIKYERI